jgi:hypothetical protein
MGKARCFAVLVLLFAEHFASDADDRLSAAGDEFLAMIDKQPNIRKLPSGVRYVVQNTKKQADTRYGRLTNSMPKLDTKCKIWFKGWYPVSAIYIYANRFYHRGICKALLVYAAVVVAAVLSAVPLPPFLIVTILCSCCNDLCNMPKLQQSHVKVSAPNSSNQVIHSHHVA